MRREDDDESGRVVGGWVVAGTYWSAELDGLHLNRESCLDTWNYDT